MTKARFWMNSSLVTKEMEIHNLLSRIQSHGKCVAVLESTGNMWMRIHDTLEENGIDTKLANPYKTKIIAEARIKSDKLLDAIGYYLIYYGEQI
jgi:transposase